MDKRGWYSRGYLPHFDAPELVQMLTFHLADALPRRALIEIEAKLDELPEGKRKTEKRRRLGRWLDAGQGACHLKRPEVARIVLDRILAADGEECMLLAWCVMPNHVHVVCELADDVELWKMLKDWKGSTGHDANVAIGRRGTFWFREYHDRYVRDAAHLRNAILYTERNPVDAGLCAHPEDWPHSSARWRANAE